MKSSTIKELGIVSLVVLCVVLLWQNRSMRDELRQYRAVENFLAAEDRTGAECRMEVGSQDLQDETARRLLRIMAAQKGDASAQLGFALFELGEYPSIQDIDAKREKWLLAAARQGDPECMYSLAEFYNDRGALQRAFHWYREGALRNDARCMAALGQMYLDGEWVKADAEKAEYWFKKAEAAGCSDTLLESWRARCVIPQNAR